MFNHPTGYFSGDYNSALRGCWPLKFLHTLQLPKMYFKSYLGRRAASCWALPHISSLFLVHLDLQRLYDVVRCEKLFNCVMTLDITHHRVFSAIVEC